ncbi:cytochrome P450 [Methylocapsa acidiphila]|uniref:cytochrome P450 n=1 Tax=Methylocapsa acidiphila TaxID=133552 RepID=UPI000404BF69|nr:cytochrome P450 [Methylocapsa acidiphila]
MDDVAKPRANRTPPGPKGLPFLGNLLELKRDPLGFLANCAAAYGDVARLRLGGQPAYLVNNAKYIESILVTNAGNFVKTAGGTQARPRAARRAPDLMTWVRNFPSDGEAWLPDRELAHPDHRERRDIQPAFHAERIESYAAHMVALTVDMLATWKHGEARDIHADMTHLSVAIIAKTLFGAEASADAETLAESFRVVIAQIVSQMVDPIHFPSFVPTPHQLRLRKAIRQIEAFLNELIRQRRNEQHDDFLSLLLAAHEDKGGAVGENNWRYQAMTVFVAGYETTALTLTWALYLISQNPDVEARLLDELHAVLGGRPPSAADVRKLRYADMVIKETLRLYPPVWLLGPRVGVDAFEVGPYRLPAGATVLISPWVTHRDPRYFAQPEKFDPDRWSEKTNEPSEKYAYFPFSGGERQCIGKSYATMEAVLLLATILQGFRLELVPEARVAPQALVTLQPRRGLPMRVTAL